MLRFSKNLTEQININDLRLAIFNFILSKQLNEKLQIRINDLDKEKNINGIDKEILELLNLFSIEYETVSYQSENLKYHQKLAMQLMSQKKAFACFCSDEKLKELPRYDGFCATLSDETVLNCNAPFVVRIKEPSKDSQIDSFIILNHDKTATETYATAVDDMIFNTSTILSYKDCINDFQKQSYIRSLLNYTNEINYIKINKIEENINVKDLIDEGFLPSAIANYLVLIGNDTPEDVFTLEDAISWFDINTICNSPINFDIKKLKELNKIHLKNIDNLRFSKILGFADEDIGKLGKLYIENSSTIKEIKENIDSIFSEKATLEDYKLINEIIKSAPFFSTFSELEKYLQEKSNLDKKTLEPIVRFLLTGKNEGPNLSEIYSYIKNYLGEITK